jgi:hypothetical protein
MTYAQHDMSRDCYTQRYPVRYITLDTSIYFILQQQDMHRLGGARVRLYVSVPVVSDIGVCVCVCVLLLLVVGSVY